MVYRLHAFDLDDLRTWIPSFRGPKRVKARENAQALVPAQVGGCFFRTPYLPVSWVHGWSFPVFDGSAEPGLIVGRHGVKSPPFEFHFACGRRRAGVGIGRGDLKPSSGEEDYFIRETVGELAASGEG
jgi:hypothetical protein